MLQVVIFEVLNEFLGMDIGTVDIRLSDNCRLELMIDKTPYEDFILKTKRIISEDDIVSHNEDKFVLEVTMNLTDEFINKITPLAKQMFLNEFEGMKKSRL